jgi:hypothetical protein
MAAQATLVLRDIHQPPVPPWWPPAPGWWLLAALIVAAVLVWAMVKLRRHRRRTAHAALFDAALAATSTRPQQVAAMSGLLRRAARQRDRDTETLQGEAWLAWLDGDDPARPFTTGPGRWLLDGGFRSDVEADRLDALRPVARARFLQLLETGRSGARRGSGSRRVRSSPAGRTPEAGAASRRNRLITDAGGPPGQSVPVEPGTLISKGNTRRPAPASVPPAIDGAMRAPDGVGPPAPARDIGPTLDQTAHASDDPAGPSISERETGPTTGGATRAPDSPPAPPADRGSDGPARP